LWGSSRTQLVYGRNVKVYLSRDHLWRIEVRDDQWVYVFHRSTPMGRFPSLREAAEWLVDQGVTELVEN
jgi:hypothetical protein